MPDSPIKTKSNNTFDAGVCLLDNDHHNSSVHCFYYSSYQLLLHFLHCNGYSEDSISNVIESENSHNNVRNEVKKLLVKNKINFFDLFDNYMKLKTLRKKADYSISGVASKEANKCKIKAEEFSSQLNEIIDGI